jgi:hypothetical protein
MNNLRRICCMRGLTIPALAEKTKFTMRSLERMARGNYPLHHASKAREAWQLVERRFQMALGTTLGLTQLLEP